MEKSQQSRKHIEQVDFKDHQLEQKEKSFEKFNKTLEKSKIWGSAKEKKEMKLSL